MNEEEEREAQAERPRPRIIDKRVSARPAGGTNPPTEPTSRSAPSEAAPPPEPDSSSPVGTPSVEAPPPGSPPATEAPEPGSGSTTSPEESGSTSVQGPGDEVWTPEQEAQAQQLAREIAERPSEDWVLNIAITLANVAGAKLDLGVPEDARLAIDSLEAIVNGVGDRLGEAQAPLRQTLAQLQLAYAQAVAPPPTS